MSSNTFRRRVTMLSKKRSLVGVNLTIFALFCLACAALLTIDPQVRPALTFGLGSNVLGIALGLAFWTVLTAAAAAAPVEMPRGIKAVSYTHLRAHETDSYLVCRL